MSSTMLTQMHRQGMPALATANGFVSPLVNALDNGDLAISSIDLAPGLGVKHKSLIETIRTHRASIEQFGQLPFKTASVKNSVGAVNDTTYVLLNENQALFVCTLSRNTIQVVNFKITLVKEFDRARKAIETIRGNTDSAQITALIQLVNELTGKVISLQRSVASLKRERTRLLNNKKHERILADISSQQEYKITEEDRAKRDKAMAMISTAIARYCYNYDNTWKGVWKVLQAEYNLDIHKYTRFAGEHLIDVALRRGHIRAVYEIIYANYSR